MNYSVNELSTTEDDALIERAATLLPEIGKLLAARIACQPRLAHLSVGQIKTMGHLATHARQTVGEIASGLGVAMPTASELVDRLVEAGLAERAVNPENRRQVHVWLTPEAVALSTEVRGLRHAQLRAALARLAPAERPVFVRSLEALVAALRDQPAPAATTHEAPTSTPTPRRSG